MATLDLNADVGEGFGAWTLGDDAALLGVVTSASIACGFHAGDPVIMRRTCRRAAERGVTVGAHVGYRDLAGFGRRPLRMPADELAADVLYQLGALEACARAAGTGIGYVKPHGALYTTAVTDHDQAGAIARAIADFRPGLAVLGLPGSALLDAAGAAGLEPVPEAFADRAYDAAGALVPRRLTGAVLHDAGQIAARCLRLATQHTVTAIDGTEIAVSARSICVHGDTPDAVAIATGVRAALCGAGIELTAFARS